MPSSPAIYTLSLHDALPISPFGVTQSNVVAVPKSTTMTAPFACSYAATALTIRSAPTSRGFSYRIAMPVRMPGPTIFDSLPNADRKSTRLNSSHMSISYAVFPRHLHPFPTRRSSDLAFRRDAIERGRRSEIDDDDGALRLLVRGDGVDDSVRADLARIFVQDRHAGANAGADDLRFPAERRSEEHTSELQSHVNLVCRLPPPSTPFPYTTLFRSRLSA